MTKVIVTGASGYIGGQTMLMLRDQGHRIIGVDLRALPRHLQSVPDRFYHEDFSSANGLSLIDEHRPAAIVHCAGTSLVGPSISDPESYYRNNFVKTKCLLDHVIRRHPRIRIIFSSSAAVYGDPVITPCQEEDPALPVSPYGESKLMIEMMLRAYHRAYDLDFVAFRYFNACGADGQGRHGQEPGATHIIARVLESMRDRKTFTLYGDDYPTPDGTCVRDYVHVADIARAHVLALEQRVPSDIYNLGSNAGFSNRDVVSRAQLITGRSVDIEIGSARSGDPAVLTASFDKFRRITDWKAEHSLDDMINHAWTWYNKQC